MSARLGSKPWNWRGAPIMEPRGYILIHVGKDHPLSDCRGYAYEHRLVAASSGMDVTGLQVHHVDETKGNNALKNLEPLKIHTHRSRHRKSNSKLRLPDEDNPMVSCSCGCGSIFNLFDKYGRPRRVVSGHNLTPNGGVKI